MNGRVDGWMNEGLPDGWMDSWISELLGNLNNKLVS